MKDKKIIFRISFLVVLALFVIGITYAWFVWKSPEDKNVSVTIGDVTVNYEDGSDITNINLIPVSSKEKGIVKNITVSSSSPTTLYLNLYLNVKMISDLLKEESFKWAIYNGDRVINEGDFSNAVNDNDITLLDSIALSKSEQNYILYIWIDGNMPNPSDMFNQSFDFYLHADASNENKTPIISGDELVDRIKTESNGVKDTVTDVATTDEGVWETEDDYGTTYYFRGAVENNYVKFADYYWRIVRINGDGSIRLIYDGTTAHANGESSEDRQIGTSAFNENFNDNAYVGYMYGTPGSDSYEETHANINDSTIKTVVDNWYKTNIEDKGYGDKVADAIYCNDRQIASDSASYSGYGTLGYGENATVYAPASRIFTTSWKWESTQEIKMTCSQKNDAFTVDDTSKGNGSLTYPVGLLTVDEILAGGSKGVIGNSSYYLYTGQNYFTMSPDVFINSFTLVFDTLSGGGVSYNKIDSVNGVRLVLSLKPSVKFSGSGTMTDPYVVQP